MSAGLSNLERKKFNLLRLKQMQAEKQLEESMKSEKSPLEDVSESATGGLRKKASQRRMICRSDSSMSNTSNVEALLSRSRSSMSDGLVAQEDHGETVEVEEGSWYDVFKDDPLPCEQSPSVSTPHRPTPKKGINSVRRSLSEAPSPSATSPLPVKIQASSGKVSQKVKQHKLHLRRASTTPEPDKSKLSTPSIFSKFMTATVPSAVNLVSLRENGSKSPTATQKSTPVTLSAGSNIEVEHKSKSEKFKDLRSKIDDQLFHS